MLGRGSGRFEAAGGAGPGEGGGGGEEGGGRATAVRAREGGGCSGVVPLLRTTRLLSRNTCVQRRAASLREGAQ